VEQIPEISARIEEAELALKGKGRVVVRYSGTEALARIMIEAESREEMERHAERIAQAIRSKLGV
jgi:phosphoglucosamine mutase